MKLFLHGAELVRDAERPRGNGDGFNRVTAPILACGAYPIFSCHTATQMLRPPA
jgi:hypothetical protein